MPLEVVPTRYGAAAVDALAAAVAHAKDGEPLRPVTVVVPSNYAGVAARRALARRGGVVGVSFVTLYRLAELLGGVEQARRGRVPISSPVVATAVRAVLSDRPGLFAPVADQPSTVEALRRVHRELRDLTEGELDALARADARAAAVVGIDRRLTAQLSPRWYDETDLMVAATAVVRAAGQAGTTAGDIERVVVHLPQQLSAAGAELLLALAGTASVTVLAGLTGAADDPHRRVLERLGEPPATLPPDRNAAPVEVAVAADEDDEVRLALRRIIRAAEEGIPLERVVVVHAPTAAYGRLLADHLDAAGLPWNGVADVALTQRLAGRTLLGLLDLDPSAMRRRELFTLLAAAPSRSDRPIAAWERLAREAAVVGGRHQWQERLAVRARDLRQRAEEMRRSAEEAGDEPAEGEGMLPWPVVAAERAEALARFVSVLADRLAPPDRPTWAAHSRWARRLLEHVIGGPERRVSWSRDEQRAADRVDGILDRLARLDAVADSTGHHAVDRTAFRAALEAELADGPATQGRLGEGLFVAPIPLAVGIDADVVIVLGLMEGSLPGGLGDDPLLADASRQAVGGALLTAAQRRAQLHHQLHAVVGAAARTVVLSRPRADLRTGSARYASRWLPGLVTAASPPTWRHTSFDHGLHDPLPPASEQEAVVSDLHRVVLAGHGLEQHPLAGGDDALRRAVTLLRARASEHFTAFDGNLSEVAAAGADLSPRSPTAATVLEAWATCPFGYFARHVLGVRELDQRDEELFLRPTARGILVHAVLEAVIAAQIDAGTVPAPDAPWSDAVRAGLQAELEAHCVAVAAEGNVGPPLHWRLEQRRLRRRIDAFLVLDGAARAEHGVAPVAAEMPFGYDPRFELTLPNRRVLALFGTVDRVDAGPDRVAVIDYKTGRSAPVRAEDPLEGGTRLQLPIYGLAARRLLGREQAAIVAEYWQLDDRRAQRTRRLLPVDDQTIERLGEVLAAMTEAMAEGVFVPHPAPPDPWRRSRCAYCDPDGADTATLWSQWQHKRDDPALATYVALSEPEAEA